MTLQNRVTPFNALVADPHRGLFMGNRGVLHDSQRDVVRWRNGKRWIICVTDFKGRRRTPMTPGQYTELFFLDEPTALAAGHRPCAECRRERFDAYRRAIAGAGGAPLWAPELDAQLDLERRDGNKQRRHVVAGPEIPDGAMITIDDTAFLVVDRQLRAWSPSGYGDAASMPGGDLEVLTPPLTLRALRGGYVPES
jgi:hypothetical protein